MDHGDGGGGTATLPSRSNVATIRPERTAKTGGGCGRRTPPPRPLRAGPSKALHVTPPRCLGTAGASALEGGATPPALGPERRSPAALQAGLPT